MLLLRRSPFSIKLRLMATRLKALEGALNKANYVSAIFLYLGASVPGSLWAESFGPSQDPCVGKSFYHARMNAQQVFLEFTGAVFRIQAKKEKAKPGAKPKVEFGTGFLIDARQGYVLTAYHVVRDAFENPPATIEATSAYLPDLEHPLTLTPVAKAVDRDVALLKVADTSHFAIGRIRPLDIAFHFFAPGTPYFTIGYPRGKDSPNTQTAEIQGTYEGSSLLDVKQSAYNGQSGSPLLDENGAVLAIAVSYINVSEALYVPLVDVQDLLNKIPAGEIVELLDSQVRSTKPSHDTQQRLLQQLKWISGNPSNLELYQWASLIAKQRYKYDATRVYFECPIVPAYSDRRLADARVVKLLSGLMPPVVEAKLLLDSGEQALMLGRTTSARESSQRAEAIYASIPNPSGTANALTLLGRTYLQSKEYQQAAGVLRDALDRSGNSSDKAEIKVYLAQAYLGSHDLNLASEYASAALREEHGLRQSRKFKAIAIGYDVQGQVAAKEGRVSDARHDFRFATLYFKKVNDVASKRATDRALAQLPQEPSKTKVTIDPTPEGE